MAAGKGSKGSRGKKRPPARRSSGTPAAKRPARDTTGAGAGNAGAAPGPAPKGVGPTLATAPPAGSKPKPTRTERLEAARRARKRKATMVRVGVAGGVALLVLVVALVVVDNRRDASAARDRLTAGSCSFDTKADPTSPPPANHVAPASYKVDPPAGGNHSPQAAAAGLYGGEGQPAPGDPQIVHALEHGYVVVWHRPDLDDADLTAVREAYDRYPDDVAVVPRASLDVKVAATAWGRRLLCPEVEAARLTDFVRLYRNEGPEKIPHT